MPQQLVPCDLSDRHSVAVTQCQALHSGYDMGQKCVLLKGVLALMSVITADSFVSGISKLLCKGLHSLQACLRGWSLTQSFD